MILVKIIKGRFKIFTGIGLFLITISGSIFSRMIPGFAEWYSTHLYPVWIEITGRAAACFPFSVAEILLYILSFIFLISVIRLIAGGIQRKAGKKEIYDFGVNIFLAAGILFFLYMVNCGINYQRNSFCESSGIAVKEYSSEELKEVCLQLTSQVNKYSGQVERDEAGVMILDNALQNRAVKAMEKVGERYTELAGYYSLPKGLMNSWLLSVQGLTGIYSPFTIEANYNNEMTDYNIPFTVCHELSHLKGFMQEQEANFIAFLACTGTEEADFNYSGNLMGWIQCMNVLYKTDYDAWEEVRGQLSPEVEPDLDANREFWARYDGAVAEVSNKVNDTYLKANGQADGVKSYNRMVDLIVAYYMAF